MKRHVATRWVLVPLALVIAFVSSLGAQDHHHGESGSEVSESEQQSPEYRADMAKARHALHHHAGGQFFGMVLVDRLEVQEHSEADVAVLDLSGWYGGDLSRFAFEIEGKHLFNRESGSLVEADQDSDWEKAEISGYWTRAVSRYIDFKVGARYDLEPDSRAYAVVGVQGLAPYWFEVDAELFLSEDGDVSARFESEYEVLFTQKLIGQIRFEVEANAQTDLARETGSGLSGAEAGFRLRYEIRREFAPYVGIETERAFGTTKDILRAAQEETSSTSALVGVRLWF